MQGAIEADQHGLGAGRQAAHEGPHVAEYLVTVKGPQVHVVDVDHHPQPALVRNRLGRGRQRGGRRGLDLWPVDHRRTFDTFAARHRQEVGDLDAFAVLEDLEVGGFEIRDPFAVAVGDINLDVDPPHFEGFTKNGFLRALRGFLSGGGIRERQKENQQHENQQQCGSGESAEGGNHHGAAPGGRDMRDASIANRSIGPIRPVRPSRPIAPPTLRPIRTPDMPSRPRNAV